MAHPHTTPALRRLQRIASQRGLTLVELMVALVVGLMVIMAAMSVFSTTSRSAGTVDAAGQLRDDARFAADIIQRIAVQTGFEDIGFVTRTYQGTPQTYKGVNGQVNPLEMLAPISGFSGKKVTGTASTDIQATAPSPLNGNSDVLVLRYQAVNKGDSLSDADGSMLVCSGAALGAGHGHDDGRRTQRAVSIFYVDDSDGEPTLFCNYANKEGETLQAQPIPLVKGVESFRVLYGVDNIEPNTKVDAASATEHAKLVPTRFLTADQMTVSNDTAANETNWRRVRALRIGIVLRSGDKPIQGGQMAAKGILPDENAIDPLGKNFGSSYVPNNNAGDARLRQDYTFTINVRNCLNQGYQPAGNPGDTEADLRDIPPCDVVVPRA